MAQWLNSIHCMIQELENGVELPEDEYIFIYECLEVAREYFENLEIK